MPSAPGLFPTQPHPSKHLLLDWLKSTGSLVNDAIEIYESDHGWGVRATRDIDFDELLLSVPKTSILSSRTTSLKLPTELLVPEVGGSDWASQVTTNLTVPTLALILLHEIRLGEEGRYWGYIQSLPRDVDLPIFWDEEGEAKKWLRGTEAGRELRKREETGVGLADLKRFYEATKHLLSPTLIHSESSPVEAYLYAYSLISTRAFLIDIYHTLALVPFADILNHSSAPHTSLASDDFVCHLCGRLGQCSHDTTMGGVPERLAHVDPHSRVMMGREIGTVDMRSERMVECGEEVMNSYGKGIGDGRLLVEWGFLEGEFTGNGIEWTVAELLGDESNEGRATRGVFDEIIKSGVVALELYPDHDLHLDEDLEDDNEKLIGPPITTSTKSGDPDGPILNLNNNGQISLNIWIALFLQSCRRTSCEELESAIVSSVTEVETANIAPKSAMDPTTMSICQKVITLLEQRLDGMYRSTMSMEELLDRRDALATEENDLRMAMTLTIDERALLSSALDQWEGLVTRVKPKKTS